MHLRTISAYSIPFTSSFTCSPTYLQTSESHVPKFGSCACLIQCYWTHSCHKKFLQRHFRLIACFGTSTFHSGCICIVLSGFNSWNLSSTIFIQLPKSTSTAQGDPGPLLNLLVDAFRYHIFQTMINYAYGDASRRPTFQSFQMQTSI